MIDAPLFEKCNVFSRVPPEVSCNPYAAGFEHLSVEALGSMFFELYTGFTEL